MKKLLLALFLSVGNLSSGLLAQVPTQEQLQAVDVKDSGLNDRRSQGKQSSNLRGVNLEEDFSLSSRK